MVKRVETLNFLESFVPCDLKVGKYCRRLIELMKLSEYSMSRSFFDHAQRSRNDES